MATEVDDIIAEVEELGRLDAEQEQILYNIALRQEELGRQPTNVLLSRLEGSPLYQPLIDREYLTVEVYDHGDNSAHAVANLIVTLKGMRYCIHYADEIEPNRRWNVAGERRY